MGKLPDETTKLSDTLSLSEYKDPKHGDFGFWLYDETVGFNLAWKAKTREGAILEALKYHQKARADAVKQRDELQAVIAGFIKSLKGLEDHPFEVCTNCRADD
jgi:hypothetical protein